MRVLLVSDIHGNFDALQAVLEDARSRGGVDAVWNLGDTVGYGAEPGRCLQYLAELQAVSVAGNHDLAAIGRIPVSDFNPFAAAAIVWTGNQLTAEHKAYIAGLPLRWEQDGCTLVHGSPRDPVWEYVLSEDVAGENFPLFATPVCLLGHTHIPTIFVQPPVAAGSLDCEGWLLEPGERLERGSIRLIYNPGGVGQPRDGDPRAAYAIFDTEAQCFAHYRVAYDVEAAQAKIRAAGLPEHLAARLGLGR